MVLRICYGMSVTDGLYGAMAASVHQGPMPAAKTAFTPTTGRRLAVPGPYRPMRMMLHHIRY
eukprot:3940264-Rhodomonas_salina.2